MNRIINVRAGAVGACVLAAFGGGALAQEAMYTAAATMPSEGVVIVRPLLNVYSFGSNPSDGTDSTQRIEALTTIQLGLARGLSFTLDVPVEFDRRTIAGTGAVDHDQGVQDLNLTFKYRLFKDDTGGIDTVRGAILAGAYVASGDDHDFSSMSINPHLGFVLTVVNGRHGFNQEVNYQFNTSRGDAHNLGGGRGRADSFTHNTSYLYRLSPDQYTASTPGAIYATVELNGIYEINGDYELRWSPGIMYEGKDFALELMAQFPLYHHLRERAELDFTIGLGIRFTF